MRICERALNFIQVIDYRGTVRICGWIKDNEIGKLTEQSFIDIFHGKKARKIRNKLFVGDYSDCIVDACPFCAMDKHDEHMVELDEVPEYPEELYLAYEEVCNYNCTSCTTPETMRKQKCKELEEGYKKIEQQLEEVLPHIRMISANGRGEVFVSKHILNILAHWKPLVPPEKATVYLETNGALFDEEHWKKIENIGKFNVKVTVTVMSFEEKTYQLLSGTKLPVSKIEENLRFIRKLREDGVINYFEIATVVQERNFRYLPEFTERCIEEFNADCIRLRPYMPWGSKEPEVEWFTDVRNPMHPYNEEYLEIMAHPIFRHPKVCDWSGGLPSNTGDFPYRRKMREMAITKQLVLEEKLQVVLKEKVRNDQVIIYGLGDLGKVFAKLINDKINILCMMDKQMEGNELYGKKIFSIGTIDDSLKCFPVIVTVINRFEEIKSGLEKSGFTGEIINLENLFCQ